MNMNAFLLKSNRTQYNEIYFWICLDFITKKKSLVFMNEIKFYLD